MDQLDDRKFAQLCRNFIDAAAPAIHNGLEHDSEPETPQRVTHNLRFIFTSVVPFFFKDTMLELASLIAQSGTQKKIALRQDKASIDFADAIAMRLLEDHSLYAIRRFVPEELAMEGRATAQKLNLPNLAKVL